MRGSFHGETYKVQSNPIRRICWFFFNALNVKCGECPLQCLDNPEFHNEWRPLVIYDGISTDPFDVSTLHFRSGNKFSYLSATNLKHLLQRTCCFSSFLLSNQNLFFMIVRPFVMIVQHLSHLKFNVFTRVFMKTTSSSGVFMTSWSMNKQKKN